MKFDISLIRLAGSLASHSAKRQSVIAQNVANADTPGYRARDLRPFAEILQKKGSQGAVMQATRPGHIREVAGSAGAAPEEIASFAAEAPNGNNVSLEDQMVRSAEVRQSHDLALGVYRSSMNILRMGLGRR